MRFPGCVRQIQQNSIFVALLLMLYNISCCACLLADSFKTLKHILLNTAEDIPALQAFLVFFSKLNVAGIVYFAVELSSEELHTDAQTHTHTHTRDFSARLTLNESNRTIFYSYCSQ